MGSQKTSRKLLTALIATSFVASPAVTFAANPLDALYIDGGELQFSAVEDDKGDVTSNTVDARLGLGVNLTEALTVHFRGEIGDDVEEWTDLFDEAVFVVDKELGFIHAIRAGQQDINLFGQQMNSNPLYKDNLMYAYESAERKLGASMQITPDLVNNILDNMELAIYKQGEGDQLDTEGDTVVVGKIKKAISDALAVEASFRTLDGDWSESDISVAGTAAIDKIRAHAQLLILGDSGENGGSERLVQIGAEMDVTDTNFVVGGDITYVDQEAGNGEARMDYTGFAKWVPQSFVELAASYTFQDGDKEEDVLGTSVTFTSAPIKSTDANLKGLYSKRKSK